MTGAMPSISGIVGNQWFDREANKQVTSVSDDATGPSPRKLLVSTLGDEMKIASRGQCRVVGISLKDRAAVLPAGHMADGAYWFSGKFVSSTFYFPKVPEWVSQFNSSHPPPMKPADFEASPDGNDLLEAFVERAIEAENLGAHAAPDLLTVSFSSNDYVGHRFGPDSPEVHAISLRTDQTVGRLLDFLDRRLGLNNVLVVLTADHGVAPLPELLAERKMPGGRLPAQTILQAIQTQLTARFGDGKWVAGVAATGPYLNRDLIRAKKLDETLVEDTAAQAVARIPHVLRVYTRTQLLNGRVANDFVGRAVLNGFFPSRSGDLAIVLEPYWIADAHEATHGSPFAYDTHVPVIFLSPRIKPGRYGEEIAPNDIAPTLAALLEVETPSGSCGRVLTEIIAP
jgi:hypothetical protein